MKLTKSALREIIKSVINEDLDKGNDDNCWDGYTQLGMKTKNGKEVPNCVPIKESTKLREMIGNVINEEMLPYKETLGKLLKKKFPNVKFTWNNDSKGYWTTDNKFVDKYSTHRTNVNHSARKKLKQSMNGLIINDDFDKIEITID
jgi:hypothetical protein